MLVKAKSLSAQLIVTLVVLLTAFGVAQGVSTYHLARVGIDALLDARLSNVAGRIRDVFSQSIPQHPSRGSQDPDDIVILVWSPGSETAPTRTTDTAVIFPRGAPAGFSQQGVTGQAWRVYTLRDGRGVVQVGQRESVRQSMAEASALRALLPIFVLIPAVWVSVYFSVRRTFGVLNRLGENGPVDRFGNLAPLPGRGLPVELQPFVDSINRMIERLAESMKSERDFISDAAHELRSPLTALQLQADNLQQDIAPGNQERFQALRRGIERSSALISQLLSLARADAQVAASEFDAVDVTETVSAVVSELLPIATHKRIDIGAETLMPAHIRAMRADVRAVVKNLVGNALRYTPTGGAIDLQVLAEGGMARVRVVDTGPGIPEALLPRVFDRFFRVDQSLEGSGLGLSIVKAITARYGGTVVLRNRDDGTLGPVCRSLVPAVAGQKRLAPAARSRPPAAPRAGAPRASCAARRRATLSRGPRSAAPDTAAGLHRSSQRRSRHRSTGPTSPVRAGGSRAWRASSWQCGRRLAGWRRKKT